MRLDLHVHSTSSRDGTAGPEDIVRRTKQLGLDGVAITDHNAVEGSARACSMASAEGILVVSGVEVSSAEGHVLAYGLRELVPRGRPLVETVDMIRSAGGVAVAAHPERFPSGMGLELAGEVSFDGIEVLNGGSSRRGNRLARRLAESKGLPVTGGSDAHSIDQVGKSFTVVDNVSSEDDVLKAIRNGKTSVGGRSRTRAEGVVYSLETLVEWLKGDLRRL